VARHLPVDARSDQGGTGFATPVVKLQNFTAFRAVDLRRFFGAGLRAMGASSNKTIEVRLRSRRWRCSRARLGEVVELSATQRYYITDITHDQRFYDGESSHAAKRVWRVREAGWIRMVLDVDADGAVDLRSLARVFEHEVLHSKGVTHADMTEHQMQCDLPLPGWAVGLEVRREPAAPRLTETERSAKRAQDRESHCRAMLATYEQRQKRVAKLLAKWRARVRYYERRAAAKVVKL
jgi:hypothetical protein